MRQTLSRGMVAAAAATGILSLCGNPVYADSHADGTANGSPGVASGNSLQVPVHVPVNVCGNTVNVIAALNPAFGNACGHASGGQASSTGAHATGATSDSPGIGSGNNVQVPVHVPVNACGNGVNVAALLNQASGNSCGEASDTGASSTGAHATGSTSGSPGIGSGNNVQVPVHVPVNACGNGVNVGGLLNEVTGNSCGPDTGSGQTSNGGPGDHGTQTPPQNPQTPPQTPPQNPQTPPQTVPQNPQTPPQTVPQNPQTPPQTVPQNPQTPPQMTTPHEPQAPGVTPAGTPVTAAHPAPALAQTGSEGVIAASAVSVAMLAGGLVLYRRGRVASRF
ncbi:chaplin family protein [Streptomyces sp. NPDC008222]|uniref:chaplin n=1 Tax=Streptomyces sp. NPDC008222 TaxID=3364820 RepID=UPI0036EB1924